MTLRERLSDLRIWIILGLVGGLAVGPLGKHVPVIIMAVLILQMSIALEGTEYARGDTGKYGKSVFLGILCCFVLNAGIIVLVGSMFIPRSTAIWYGWVILASVPSAVSIVSAPLYIGGKTEEAFLTTIGIYLTALAATPLITWIFIGTAVNPLEILKYIVLFIAIPFAASRIITKLSPERSTKVISINVLFFLLLFLSLGSNRDFILTEPDIVFWVVVACFFRIFVFSALMIFTLKKAGLSREKGITYVLFSTWKNSGMSISLCMILLAGMSEAAIPCVISLIIESLWFSLFTRYNRKLWPETARAESAHN